MDVMMALYVSLNCYLTNAEVSVNNVPVYQTERLVSRSVKTLNIKSFLTLKNNTVNIKLINDKGKNGVEAGAFCDVRAFSDTSNSNDLYSHSWQAGSGENRIAELSFSINNDDAQANQNNSLSLPTADELEQQLEYLKRAINDKNIDIILQSFLYLALEKKYAQLSPAKWLQAEESFWSALLDGDVTILSEVDYIQNSARHAHPYSKLLRPVLAITNQKQTLYLDMIFTKQNKKVVIDYLDYVYLEAWTKK